MSAQESEDSNIKDKEVIYNFEEISSLEKFINMFMPQCRIKIEVLEDY